MEYSITDALEILERTTLTISAMLTGLSEKWTEPNEGEKTWSAHDILIHYVECEKILWLGRMNIILDEKGDKKFMAFDQTGQFANKGKKSISDLLEDFSQLRKKNLIGLKNKNLSESDFSKTGIHPAFGNVTLKNLLSTWVVHDLGHVAQICRVLSKQYKAEVGPWAAYLRVISN